MHGRSPGTIYHLRLCKTPGTVSGERGRCFRFVTDPDGKSVNCPERPIASGWLKIGERGREVDACGRHSAQPRFRRSNAITRP